MAKVWVTHTNTGGSYDTEMIRMLFGCYRKQSGMDISFSIICLCKQNVHHL